MSDDVILDRAANTEAILDHIEARLPGVVEQWAGLLVDEVATLNGVAVDPGLRARVLRTLRPEVLDLRPGRLQDEVLDAVLRTRREGGWGPVIDDFVTRKDLKAPRASERRLMIESLERLKVDPGSATVLDDVRDHTVARVYSELVGSAGSSDPMALTSPAGRITPWNYRVRPFESSGGGRRVRSENILAAGALAWCHEIGERMGLYPLADALVYRWWVGDVDFEDPDLVAQLYRYWKLREDRPSQEERALLYRRVLAVGDSPVSDRVVVNEHFPALWRNLMEEISLYLAKSESSFTADQISRAGVYQAAGELQYNLSEHMSGMAVLHVTEMYNQLRAENPGEGNLGALDFLEHEEVIAQLSHGSERHAATVIRRLAGEEFGVVPNVGSIGTSADKGYEIYEWLADYRPGQVDDASFRRLIEVGKAWILAQQAAGEGLTGAGTAVVEEPVDEAWDDEGWEDEVWEDDTDTREAYL